MTLLVFVLIAASPSFQSFLSSQFGVTGNQVGIKSGALVTNMDLIGDTGLTSAALDNDNVWLLTTATLTFHDVVNNIDWYVLSNANKSFKLLSTLVYSETNFSAPGRISGNVLNSSVVEVTNGAVNTLRIKTTNGNFIAMSGQPTVLTYTGSGGAANTNVTVDCSTNNTFILIATNNIFLSAINLAVGQSFYIDIVQDGTGSRLLTLNTAQWRTNSGLPTLSTAANSQDVLSCKINPFGTNVQWTLTKGL